MAKKADETNDKPKDGEQTSIGGIDEQPRPAEAGIRFSLSETAVRIKSMRVVGSLQDDEGRLSRLKLVFDLALTADEVEQLPEIGPAVVELIKLGTKLPKEQKNTFKVALSREFAGAKYTLKAAKTRVVFNGQTKGTPLVSVVKGAVGLKLQIETVVRQADVDRLTAFLEERPVLTVEPPQQELDFSEAA